MALDVPMDRTEGQAAEIASRETGSDQSLGHVAVYARCCRSDCFRGRGGGEIGFSVLFATAKTQSLSRVRRPVCCKALDSKYVCIVSSGLPSMET
eukprot:scaffold164248_cov15-Prasinocladus_malaysianus.AAC.1